MQPGIPITREIRAASYIVEVTASIDIGIDVIHGGDGGGCQSSMAAASISSAWASRRLAMSRNASAS